MRHPTLETPRSARVAPPPRSEDDRQVREIDRSDGLAVPRRGNMARRRIRRAEDRRPAWPPRPRPGSRSSGSHRRPTPESVFAPQPTLLGPLRHRTSRLPTSTGDGDLDLATVPADELSVLLGGPGATFGPADRLSRRRDEQTRSPPATSTATLRPRTSSTRTSKADKISVRLGGPGGTFGARNRFVVGDGPAKVFARDFNADGDPDLAVVNDIDSENPPSPASPFLLGEAGGGFGRSDDVLLDG